VEEALKQKSLSKMTESGEINLGFGLTPVHTTLFGKTTSMSPLIFQNYSAGIGTLA
jgi:hypothetical protein